MTKYSNFTIFEPELRIPDQGAPMIGKILRVVPEPRRRILEFLWRNHTGTIEEMAESLNISGAAVRLSISPLEEAGLVYHMEFKRSLCGRRPKHYFLSPDIVEAFERDLQTQAK